MQDTSEKKRESWLFKSMQETNEKKRERGANYTEGEKQQLLNIVAKYNHIVENKKSDGLTLKNKAHTWRKIEAEYNAVAATGQRSCWQLKVLYDNLKRKSRKQVAEKNEDPDTDNRISVKNTITANKETSIPEHDTTPLYRLNQDPLSTSKDVKTRNHPLGKRKLQPDTPTTSSSKKKHLESVSTKSGNDSTSGVVKLDEISSRAANSGVKKEDTFDIFGKYIASLLRSLPQDQSSQLQLEIVSMILTSTVPIDSTPSSTQYSSFTVNPEDIKSETSSVENTQDIGQDSVSSVEDAQDKWISY